MGDLINAVQARQVDELVHAIEATRMTHPVPLADWHSVIRTPIATPLLDSDSDNEVPLPQSYEQRYNESGSLTYPDEQQGPSSYQRYPEAETLNGKPLRVIDLGYPMQNFVREKNEQIVIDVPDQEKPIVVTVVNVSEDTVQIGLDNVDEPAVVERNAVAAP